MHCSMFLTFITALCIGCNSILGDDELCETESCNKVAEQILQSMDKSISPCDDFYNFVCGKFIANAVIADTAFSDDNIGRVKNKILDQLKPIFEEEYKDDDPKPIANVKKFYKACMNAEYINNTAKKRFKQIMQQLGSWPVLEQNWNEESFEWLNAIRVLKRNGFEANQFIHLSMETDMVDSTKYTLEFGEADFVLPAQMLIAGVGSPAVQAYLTYMVKVAVSFGAAQDAAEEQMKDALDFEISLAKITTPEEEKGNITATHNPIKISELQTQHPEITWLDYVNDMLAPVITVTEDEIVNVQFPGYTDKLKELLGKTPKRVQSNYIIWHLIAKEAITFLSDDLKDHQQEMLAAITGVTTRRPSWKECIDAVGLSMISIASAFYIKKYQAVEVRQSAIEVFENIRAALLTSIENLDWMDDVTKQQAIAKLNAMKENIGFPEQLANMTIIEEMYEGLTVNENDFIGSKINTMKAYRTYLNKHFRSPTSETAWTAFANVLTVNALYSGNSFVINIGLLQDVFFAMDRPKYLNYGAMGFLMGHEMTHAYDNSGRLQDKDGNLVDWWEQETADKFKEKAQCIIDQYSEFVVPDIKSDDGEEMRVNGIVTQGENIADNGGLRNSYFAYQKWVEKNGQEPKLPGLTEYTPNQMFWLMNANTWCGKYSPELIKSLVLTDNHAPFPIRVVGVLRNIQEFATDFSCEVGTPMNPEKKCVIW